MKLPLVSRKRMDRETALLRKKLFEAKESVKRYQEKVSNLTSRVKNLEAGSKVLQQIRGNHDIRPLLAQCLQGEGIEIGALHHPLPVPDGVKVRYVDRNTREENIKEHPELDAAKIVETHFVGNGEKLEMIPDASQDFVIANHMLEHCINPIGTIEQFVRVLRFGGNLFVSLPDKRYTFDVLRPVTPFSNPAEDYRTDRRVEPLETYVEFCKCALDQDGQIPYERQDNIHFHSWTQSEILELLIECRRSFHMPLEIVFAARNGIELIVVLRKEIPDEYDRAGYVSLERQQAHNHR